MSRFGRGFSIKVFQKSARLPSNGEFHHFATLTLGSNFKKSAKKGVVKAKFNIGSHYLSLVKNKHNRDETINSREYDDQRNVGI